MQHSSAMLHREQNKKPKPVLFCALLDTQIVIKLFVGLSWLLLLFFVFRLQIGESGVNPEVIIAAASKHKQELAAEYDTLQASIGAWLDDTDRLLHPQEVSINASVSGLLDCCLDLFIAFVLRTVRLHQFTKYSDEHSQYGNYMVYAMLWIFRLADKLLVELDLGGVRWWKLR